MPETRTVDILPPPGVVKTESDRAAEGRITDSDKIIFVMGRPQKMGGWVALNNSSNLPLGIPRALHAWRDLSAVEYLGVGTYKKLYVFDNTWTIHDITPLDSSGTLGNNPFTTTNTSPIVTVNHTAHGRISGDTVIFSGATAVGGLTLNGTFQVLVVNDANNYTFQFTSNATSGATGGGNAVAYLYEATIGVEYGVYGLGWGVGGYGLGMYGQDNVSGSTVFIEPRIWSLDHFGKFLLGSYNGGTLYVFDPNAAPQWSRATVVTGDGSVPTDFRFMFVSNERFVFALRDNMQVSHCSQGDYTIWNPSETNTANTRTLTRGTKLIAGCALADLNNLVWTDYALYLFTYTGSKFVHDSRAVGVNCGLLAPSAFTVAGNVAYWMGQKSFFMYNGSVSEIPNVEDIKKWVFDNLRSDRAFQCVAAYNPVKNIIFWFIVGVNNTDPAYYVIYHITDQIWAVGNLTRASSTFFTHGDTRPIMGGIDGYLYQHENTNDANGAAMLSFFKVAPVAVDDGIQIPEVNGFKPDFKDQVGNVEIDFTTYDGIHDAAPEDTASVIAAPTDSLLDMRLSGRLVGLTVTSNTLGGYFRLGKPTALVKNIGMRRG